MVLKAKPSLWFVVVVVFCQPSCFATLSEIACMLVLCVHDFGMLFFAKHAVIDELLNHSTVRCFADSDKKTLDKNSLEDSSFTEGTVLSIVVTMSVM